MAANRPHNAPKSCAATKATTINNATLDHRSIREVPTSQGSKLRIVASQWTLETCAHANLRLSMPPLETLQPRSTRIPTRVLRLFQQLAHAAYRADKLIIGVAVRSPGDRHSRSAGELPACRCHTARYRCRSTRGARAAFAVLSRMDLRQMLRDIPATVFFSMLCKGSTKHPQPPAGLSFLAKDSGRSGSRRCDHQYGTGWPHGCTVASRFC
jgi:hypothetical protein